MHEVSVIISNFNGAKYLRALLETLQAQREVKLEIIVVDRNSTDDSEVILAAHPHVKVVKHPPESGLVSGYHAGSAFASYDMFFFMNEDMWLESACIQRCCDLLTSSVRIASVMPVQWTYDGKDIVNAGVWFEKCLWNRACPDLRHRARWHLVKTPVRVSYANAGACLVRRSAYEQVGGWDVTFFLDDEDTDIGIRFWQRGLESWVHPDATIGHAVGASNEKKLPSTGTPVGRKRYICSLSNFLVLAFKTFSPFAFVRPVLAVIDRMMRDLLKGRLGLLALDCQALLLTVMRLPEIAAFRRANRALNAARPGEKFFAERAFQWLAIEKSRSLRRQVDVPSLVLPPQ